MLWVFDGKDLFECGWWVLAVVEAGESAVVCAGADIDGLVAEWV